ncbi:phosphate regulon sensor histidine kinase PhoR [Paraferrimonas haliotis]|uniref:Phosphate regulon sensor protein PhoR n=1 Tax=Paraferrimonas haliotis TaxID=2013866 RepID=A0AA37WW53_9GAMM|nr:phosphate regulon sensor histidine kinase PhoR [Paraferrimonas haliotis]GLS82952.1 PAS domain-containing sensor histidine kinase [Paraferrimonas haliotis]
MTESLTSRQIGVRLVLLLAVLGLLGWVLNAVWQTLFFGTLAALVWHLRQQQRLSDWLWRDNKLLPPKGQGYWEEIFNGLYRMQSQHRRKQRHLAHLLRQFRQGAEALPDAAVVLDNDFSIIWCNKMATLHLGLQWPNDQSQRIDNLLRMPEFTQYLSAREFAEPFEMVPIPTRGHKVEIRIISYGDGQYLLIGRDVQRVRQLEGMRRNFVSNVSHELKTPLTVLYGYLEMMAMSAPDNQAKAIALMQQQATRMNAMVEQLLELSRMESASTIELNKPINLASLMAEVKNEAQGLASPSHQLVFDVDTQVSCYGSEMQLHSAFSNLISNAIRYSVDGGQIEVSWQKVALGVKFSVSDQGIGIDTSHFNRLTERFYRVDDARSRDNGGSGLGLAIVKHALSAYDAELTLTSELGKGSCFSFIIPNKYVCVSSQDEGSTPGAINT